MVRVAEVTVGGRFSMVSVWKYGRGGDVRGRVRRSEDMVWLGVVVVSSGR